VSPARDERKYHNTRTELWFNAATHAESGLIDISRMTPSERGRLKLELLAPCYELDAMDMMRVESKLETIAKIKNSPDLADAFNLACYWIRDFPET
jgi:hypothetical protein